MEPLPDYRKRPDAGWVRWLRRLIRAFTGVALILLGGVSILCTVGFPGSVERAVERAVERVGFDVRMGGLFLDLQDGIVARDVQLYGSVAEPVAFLEAERLAFHFDPRAWMTGDPGLRGLRVLRAHLFPEPRERPAEALVIEEADLVLRPGRLTLEVGTVNVLGIPVAAQGTVLLGAQATDRPVSLRREDLQAMLQPHRATLRSITDFLESIECTGKPPLVQAHFDIDTADLGASVVEVRGGGARCLVREVPFEAWSLDLTLRDGRLVLDELQLLRGEEHLRASGFLDIASTLSRARVSCFLPADQGLRLLPASWRQHLDNAQVSPVGTIAGHVAAGPAPASNLFERVGAGIRLVDASLKGVWFDSLAADILWNAPAIHVSNLTARAGRGPQAGDLRADVSFNTRSKEYRGDASSSLHPLALAPVLNPDPLRQAQLLTVRDHPFHMQATFRGRVGEPDAFFCQGSMGGSNLLYRGVQADVFSTGFHMETNRLELRPFEIVRGDRSVTGSLAFAFQEGFADADLEGNIDLPSMIRLIGPGLEKSLKPYRLDGPGEASVRGRIDLVRGRRQNDFDVRLSARGVGLLGFYADHCALTYRADHGDVFIEDVQAALYGGHLSADAVLDVRQGMSNALFDVEAAWSNLAFGAVVEGLGRTPNASSDLRGICEGNLVLRGQWNEPGLASLEGRGFVGVDDGFLFRIPLLGQLSSYLSFLIPGLGFSSQTDLDLPFRVRGPGIESSQFFIYGDLLSIRGQGAYGFDQEVDLLVEAQLLRRGILADTVRLLTLPISRLLQFRLTGTLDEPTWRPLAWPPELLRTLQRSSAPPATSPPDAKSDDESRIPSR